MNSPPYNRLGDIAFGLTRLNAAMENAGCRPIEAVAVDRQTYIRLGSLSESGEEQVFDKQGELFERKQMRINGVLIVPVG